MKPGEIAHSLSRGAFYLSLERVAAILSGLVYFALLLRWLGPTKYGIMALALSFTGIATLATGNFEVFLERFAAEFQAHGKFRTLVRAHRLALLLKVALGTAAASMLALATPWIVRAFNAPELGPILPVLGVLVAFDGLSTTGRATLFGMQRYRAIFYLAGAFHVLKTLLVGLLWGLHMGLLELAIALAAVTLAQGIALTLVPTWSLRGAADASPELAPSRGGLFRAILGYAMPLMGARATFLTGQNLSKIVLGKLFEPFMLGYFSFAFQVVERFVELAHTIPSALLPPLTHLASRGESNRLRDIFNQAFRLVQVVACGLSLVVFTFAREISVVVGSSLFEPAVPLVQIMALVPLVRTAQQPLTMLFQALRKPGAVLRLAVLKFVSEFGSYLIFIPLFGLAGAGVANLFGAVASHLGAMAVAARTLPEGEGTRMRSSMVGAGALVPFLVSAWLLDHLVLGPVSILCKVLLLLAWPIAVLATRQVNRYDLKKLADVHMRFGRLARVRDAVVLVADRLAQRFEARGVV